MRDGGNIFVSVTSKTVSRGQNRTQQRVEFFEIVRFKQKQGREIKQERPGDAP